MDTEGLVTLKSIVQSALWQGKRDKGNYFRFFELAVDGLRELRLHHVKEGVKLTKVTPGLLNEVDFPEDMIDFIAIGVPVDGKFVSFTRDNDIILTTTLDGLIETQDEDVGEGVNVSDKISYGLNARGGVNLDGYYNIDYQNRRILLNSTTRTDVVLAYSSSGVSVSGETYVPVKYKGALLAWIIWQDARYDEKKLKLSEYYELQYNKEVLRLDEGYTIDEYLDALMSTYTMLPKR